MNRFKKGTPNYALGIAFPKPVRTKVEKLLAKKEKSESKEKLKKDCDKLWSVLVRSDDEYMCQFPECENPHRLPSAHHIISKGQMRRSGNLIGYYDKRNGVTLCFNHHINGVHRNPDRAFRAEYDSMIDARLKKIGLSYEKLQLLFLTRGRMTVKDLIILRDELKREVKKIKFHRKLY